MITKELGKIQSIKVGFVGYDDSMFGFSVTLSGPGWGVNKFEGASDVIQQLSVPGWGVNKFEGASDVIKQLSVLCRKAKVLDISALKNTPIEATFENGSLKEWRILEEVL